MGPWRWLTQRQGRADGRLHGVTCRPLRWRVRVRQAHPCGAADHFQPHYAQVVRAGVARARGILDEAPARSIRRRATSVGAIYVRPARSRSPCPADPHSPAPLHWPGRVHEECAMYNPSPKAPRTPPAMTAEQDAVLAHMRTSGQSLCLIACAGAGKSTMVVEVMAQVMAEKPLSLVLVFNKEAQKSLSAKLRTIDMRLQASTFHAVCYKYWRAYETIKPKHTSSKTKTILATLYSIDPKSENKKVIKKIEPVAMHVADVVKLVKNEALGCPGNRAVTEESVREL
mmetsp:Transcript_103292/g.296639  ORF Transcript_103292/g.296639 Transcript_103292/m.296639 type:complete len:285 (+) Transcript_103292:200-1054(+)